MTTYEACPAVVAAGRRVAVIGDVGGHADALRAELVRLGVADGGDGPLPEDLVVVQVGDLVHRGPDSEEVVTLVDRHLRRQPSQWVQLLGNHEAHYLRPPRFRWSTPLSRAAAATVRRWWVEGLLHAAAVIALDGEDLLVTHAGLTASYWRRILGAPRGAFAAAAQLEALLRHDDDRLFRAGVVLSQGTPVEDAGPLWASAPQELLPGWLAEPLPFSQIHGHCSLVDWTSLQPTATPEIMRLTSLDAAAKHETSVLPGGRIIGVDPGHGSQAQDRWQAWLSTKAASRPGQDTR